MIQIFYQIKCSGPYKFIGGEGKYSSRLIYDKPPSEDEIEEFVKLCCDMPEGKNLVDLEREKIKIDIHELKYEK